MFEIDPDEVEHIPPFAVSTYTKLAEEYGQEYYDMVAEKASKHHTEKDIRILDVGTGPGILPIKIVEKTSKIHIDAIDYTKDLVEIAQDKAKKHSVQDRTSFLVGDIYSLPFKKETYPFITCTGVLHGLENPVGALTELYRILKPNGYVWVFDPTILDIDENVDKILNPKEIDIFKAYKEKGKTSPFQKSEAKKITDKSPFKQTKITEGLKGDSQIYLQKTH